MVDEDRTATEQQGFSHADQAPGGRSSRGPDFGTGGEPQVPVPPYDELRGDTGENTAPTALDASNAPPRGPDPVVTDEEREGMASTDTRPEPPLGVGESSGARGEDIAPDRDDTKTTSAGRPAGRAHEGESESGPTDPASPNLQAGDQGG